MESTRSRMYNCRYCFVNGCKNSNKKIKDLVLFSLPKDKDRCRLWLERIGRIDVLQRKNFHHKSYEVCCVHFADSDLMKMTRLKPYALPTKFLPGRVCEQSSESGEAVNRQPGQSSSDSYEEDIIKLLPQDSAQLGRNNEAVGIISDAEALMSYIVPGKHEPGQHRLATSATQPPVAYAVQTPRKRTLDNHQDSDSKQPRLEYDASDIKKGLDETIPIVSGLKYDVTRRLEKLIDWHNEQVKMNGKKYDADYRLFALNLHYASPHAYRCLRTILGLPNKNTLSKFRVKIPVKLHDRVLNSLSLKLKSLPEKAKYCVICVDTMAVKRNLYYDTKMDEVIGFQNINRSARTEIASNAYVIMCQGIYSDWQQPIAYAFLDSILDYEEFDNWINDVIRKLFAAGMDIKAVISNQESNFSMYAKIVKNINFDEPYFFVDGHKIYYIFDVPHLINCLRDSLLSNNFHTNENTISWDYIKILHKHQKERNLSLLSKITKAHIEPNDVQKTKVKFAAQTFSNTVFSALEIYIELGLMPEEARETAKFVKTVNNLFDVLNSSKLKSPKKLQRALRMSEEQKTILEDAQTMFANIIRSSSRRTGDHTSDHIKTFENFQITIRSVTQLFEDLKTDGFQYLYTRNLNQDNMRKLFRAIKRGECNSDPTPVQFSRAFSRQFQVNMLTNSELTNSKLDINQILQTAEEVIEKSISSSQEHPKAVLVSLSGETDYRIELPGQYELAYIAGFLLYKCFKKHTCKEILKTMISLKNFKQTDYSDSFETCNKKAPFYGKLHLPPKNFMNYIFNLESVFVANIVPLIFNNPGSTMFTLLKDQPSTKLICPCFPTEYLLKLFVRLRIYITIKLNMQDIKKCNKSITPYIKIINLYLNKDTTKKTTKKTV